MTCVFVSVTKPLMCASAASWQRGLITVAIKTGKNFSLPLSLTWGQPVITPVGPQRIIGNFPSVRALRTTLSRPHTRARPSSPSLYAHVHARATRATSRQYCVRPAPPAPALCNFFPPFLNDKFTEKGVCLCGCALSPPTSGGVRGSKLVGWRPRPLQNTIYCINNGRVSSCEHRPLNR